MQIVRVYSVFLQFCALHKNGEKLIEGPYGLTISIVSRFAFAFCGPTNARKSFEISIREEYFALSQLGMLFVKGHFILLVGFRYN